MNKEIEILKKLIKIPTYQKEGMKECSTFLNQELKRLGFKTRIDELNNIIATKQYNPEGENFLINAHFDTVSPGKEWKTDPLKPVKKKHMIYGLGATDDKGSIACLISALEEVEESEIKKLFLLLSSHEDCLFRTPEKNWNGTEWALKKKKIPAKRGLVLEPTCLNNKLTVRIGCGGSVSYRITAKGKEVHSSRVEEGENAIYKMIPLLNEIKKMKPEKLNLHGNELSAQFSVNLIKGGRAIGIIPGECMIRVQRRLMPTEDDEKIIKNFMNKIKPYQAEIEETYHKKPYLIEPEHELVEELTKSFSKNLQTRPEYSIIMGGTDATHLKELNKTRTVIFGPGENPICHQPNEYINVNRMKEFTKTLTHFLRVI